jgi:DNA helicase-2/ATP-dependent DNA helicase PcrA
MDAQKLSVQSSRSGELNRAQREAATYGIAAGHGGAGPLLIIAGAGSGKTTTLAHRVAELVLAGADAQRVLMLTFTRRAAADMARRAERIVTRASRGSARIAWAGTFHSVANRLLRLHARAVGLDPSFTVLDRSDSADLMDVVRSALAFDRKNVRFPKKSTCLAIYSHAVNTQSELEATLREAFPWCDAWAAELRTLFRAYVDAKQKRNVLDYDDLLLWWSHLMSEPALAAAVGNRFDHVLVDEYQDTNVLQAAILFALKPDGKGVTVVGDDAQAIYSFRGATVRNILDFPARYEPAAHVITLAQNYRSTQPILDAANAVIGLAAERFTKNLTSVRRAGQTPRLVTAEDEAAQVDYVVARVLERREAGVELKRQAVLFRAAHHSDALEVELARRNIPFVKFGGLKFLEAAHIKDVLCVLRWAENPRDETAAFRVLQLLPGVGPVLAARVIHAYESDAFELASLWSVRVPSAAAEAWTALLQLLARLRSVDVSWHGQLAAVRAWYEPHLERIYDHAYVRTGDLEQLEQIAGQYGSRERFLTELTLDPPQASGDEAGSPHLDEDFLILSTIHSAKGQEFDSVYVLNVVDGCIPSDMATDSPDQVEEERRLLYVAMTRARDELHLVAPLRFYVHGQARRGDRHVYAPRSRFLPDTVLPLLQRCTAETDAARCTGGTDVGEPADALPAVGRVDVAARLRGMW